MARKKSKAAKAKKVKAVKRPKKPETVLRADRGAYVLTGEAARLIVRRAQEVETAMDRLPAGALHANREDAIRYNLFVITDGAVGIGYPKAARMGRGGRVTKPKRGDYRRPEKPSAVRSLKRVTMDLAKTAGTKMAEQAGTAAWVAFLEALRRLVDFLSH
jgi:hypothetical protein